MVKMKFFTITLNLLLSFVIFGISNEQNAIISILSSRENVQIRFDSVLIGYTPFENFEVSPGEHILEAFSPYDGLWNTNNIVHIFKINAGVDTTIKIKFPKSVKINSIPYHAKLIFNNTLVGLTPLVIPFEDNKGKNFSLEKEGYKSFRFFLEKPESKLITLESIDFYKQESNTFSHNLIHRRLKTKFLFLSGTVITHWLAFYLKNVADNNFDKYEKTADPTLMDRYWNNTQRYDRYSDISLGVSYALLSGLIYTVLRN
jgi:hypothetical protein